MASEPICSLSPSEFYDLIRGPKPHYLYYQPMSQIQNGKGSKVSAQNPDFQRRRKKMNEKSAGHWAWTHTLIEKLARGPEVPFLRKSRDWCVT